MLLFSESSETKSDLHWSMMYIKFLASLTILVFGRLIISIALFFFDFA